MVSNLLDNNQFEPVYTGWQTEYSGFILVIIFWILTVRHISRVLKQNQALTEHLEDQVQKRTPGSFMRCWMNARHFSRTWPTT